MNFIKKLVIVHHDVDDHEKILGTLIIPYTKSKARELMNVEEKKRIDLFYLDEIDNNFNELPEQKKTPLLADIQKRIKNKPILNRQGVRVSVAPDVMKDTKKLERNKTKIDWKVIVGKSIVESIKKESECRKITTSSLVENILAEWLNKKLDVNIKTDCGLNANVQTFYNIGKICNIEKKVFGYSDIESIIDYTQQRVDNIKRRLEKSKNLTGEIEVLFDSVEKIDSIPDEFKIYFYAGALGVDLRIFRP